MSLAALSPGRFWIAGSFFVRTTEDVVPGLFVSQAGVRPAGLHQTAKRVLRAGLTPARDPFGSLQKLSGSARGLSHWSTAVIICQLGASCHCGQKRKFSVDGEPLPIKSRGLPS